MKNKKKIYRIIDYETNKMNIFVIVVGIVGIGIYAFKTYFNLCDAYDILDKKLEKYIDEFHEQK